MEDIEAQYIVGCDGAKSIVRHTLGMSFPGTTFERFFYVADVELDWEFGHDALHVCLARSTITAFFPMPGGTNRYRIVGTFPEEHDREEGEVLYEEIEKQILADTEMKLDITKVNWFSVYKVHARHANRFRRGPRFSGRGFGPYPLPRRRAGDEYRHPGRLQPGVETGRRAQAGAPGRDPGNL